MYKFATVLLVQTSATIWSTCVLTRIPVRPWATDTLVQCAAVGLQKAQPVQEKQLCESRRQTKKEKGADLGGWGSDSLVRRILEK